MIRLNDAQHRRVKKADPLPLRQQCARVLSAAGRRRAVRLCAGHQLFATLPILPGSGAARRPGAMRGSLQPRRTPARNVSCAASPFPPAATVQNTVTAVRPMLPGAMQPSASAASGQRRGVSRFKSFKSLAASGFPDTLLGMQGIPMETAENGFESVTERILRR